MLHGKKCTQWPWQSIGFQTLLRTKYVPSLVKSIEGCWSQSVHKDVTEGRTDGRKDGSVIISLPNFVGEGIVKQQWRIEEISIFSNSSHLEWRAELLDTILKWGYPRTIPAKSGLIWFSGFREELNVICYQNMPNLHNRYKSAERKISQKNPEYMLNYLPCSCS
jgi:hypothetical protein